MKKGKKNKIYIYISCIHTHTVYPKKLLVLLNFYILYILHTVY